MGSKQLHDAIDKNSELTIKNDSGQFKATEQQVPKVVKIRATNAHMPTKRDEFYYSMNHKKRGFAVILNHENFDKKNKREGTKYDLENLTEQLESLGFTVEVYNDLQYMEVLYVVEELTKRDHSQNDCFVMAVLSHGERDFIYAKDHPYKVERLWDSFTADKVSSLAGKPKWFIIQSCQGRETDHGITLDSNQSTKKHGTTTDGEDASYRIPVQADFLISYSTIPGYYSWRDTARGTWFIQSLCQELEENGVDKELLTMLTAVNRRVAFDYQTHKGEKEIPCFTSRLTRNVQFTKKIHE